jgi:hypothetical protein
MSPSSAEACLNNGAQMGVVIDAVRASDNANVMLKRINKDEDHHPYEEEVGNFLTSLGPSQANHCVPILETLHPPDDANVSIVVMPLLRNYDNPRFDTIGEAVEFFRQIFEVSSVYVPEYFTDLGTRVCSSCTNIMLPTGEPLILALSFVDSDFFSSDCNSNNIMMDGQHLFPQGFHPDPDHQHLTPDGKSNATYYTRTARPVKYYFIDFGLSRRYDPANGPPVEDIIMGGDKSPPEHVGRGECDPFPTDIYFLGNLIRRNFLDVIFFFFSCFLSHCFADSVTGIPGHV